MKAIVRTSGQLGPILKQLRKAAGWSQSALGQKIGLSQERISAIENHPERVTVDQLLTVLMALDAQLAVENRDAAVANRTTPKTASKTGKAAATKPTESW